MSESWHFFGPGVGLEDLRPRIVLPHFTACVPELLKIRNRVVARMLDSKWRITPLPPGGGPVTVLDRFGQLEKRFEHSVGFFYHLVGDSVVGKSAKTILAVGITGIPDQSGQVRLKATQIKDRDARFHGAACQLPSSARTVSAS